MNIVLKNNPGFTASWYNQYIQKSVYVALSRFSQAVKNVSIFLSDQNGPKGGKDKTCKIVIDTLIGEKIVVKATQTEWGPAIHNALKRSKYKLTEIIGKLRPANRRNRRSIRLLEQNL